MLTGDLREFAAPDLLGLLGRAGAAGALRLEGERSAAIYCTAGAVTFATNRAGSSLADVLVAAGFLDADDWAEAATSDDPPTAVAKALAARGADPVRLTSVLQRRTEEVVFELGLWRSGTFSFEPAADHLLGDAFRFPIADLLGAVATRQARWGGLLAQVGSLDHVVAPAEAAEPSAADDDVLLNRTQFRVLTAAARHLDVRTLAHDLDLGLYATCELVAGLVARRLLTTYAPAEAPPPSFTVPPGFAAAPPAAPVPPADADPAVVGNGTGITYGRHDVTPIGEDVTEVLVPVGAAVGGGGLAGFDGAAADAPLANRHTNGHANGYANGHTNGHTNGHDAPALAPNGAEFVAPGDAPARDLILRLLTAVKEL